MNLVRLFNILSKRKSNLFYFFNFFIGMLLELLGIALMYLFRNRTK